jgi:hypothetical protein
MAAYYLSCGEFQTESASILGGKGLAMEIQFTDFIPDPDGLVALVQAIKCTKGDSLQRLTEDYPSGGIGKRNVEVWTPEGWAIDAPGEKRLCPAFGMAFGETNSSWSRWTSAKGGGTKGSDGNLGRVARSPKSFVFVPAMLNDKPSREAAEEGVAFWHRFETVAIRILKDAPHLGGDIRGVIHWGYRVDEAGRQTIDIPTVARRPSRQWIDAAELWNSVKGIRGRIPGQSSVWAA